MFGECVTRTKDGAAPADGTRRTVSFNHRTHSSNLLRLPSFSADIPVILWTSLEVSQGLDIRQGAVSHVVFGQEFFVFIYLW